MKTIWKYTLRVGQVNQLTLPRTKKILHVGNQREEICVWFEVDTLYELSEKEHSFVVVGTGQVVESNWHHIGSAIFAGGDLVWHVYEVVS